MDRNVAGAGLVFQEFEDIPAANVGQVQVQGNGFGLVLFDQVQPTAAIGGDEAFEPFLVGVLIDYLGKFRVILNDHQNLVSGRQLRSIIWRSDKTGSGGAGSWSSRTIRIREDRLLRLFKLALFFLVSVSMDGQIQGKATAF